MKIFTAPQHTRSILPPFHPTKFFACLAGRYFSFGKLHLEFFISRLNVISCHDLTLSVGEPENAAAKQGQELRSGQTAINIHEQWKSLLIFCVLTIRKHLPKVDFERSGRGQEPSRGHKFSILENFLSIQDFTSQTPASFPSDLVGACLPQTLLIFRTVGAKERRVVLT